MENDVTQRIIQISANKQAWIRQAVGQCYSKCWKWRPLVSMHQCRRLCHWSTASSIVNQWKRR